MAGGSSALIVTTLLRWVMISSTQTSAKSRIERSIWRSCWTSSPSAWCRSMTPRSSSSLCSSLSPPNVLTPKSRRVARTISSTPRVTGANRLTIGFITGATTSAMRSALWIA